jgi:SAM-dependent methyltransferase
MHHTPVLEPLRHLPSVTTVPQPQGAQDPTLAVRHDYWQAYYAEHRWALPPSQFAAFVAGECPGPRLLIDVGCGQGRDALFFRGLGFHTIGIDASEQAIEYCRAQLVGLHELEAQEAFQVRDVRSLVADGDFIARIAPVPKIVYSRFFLHAIHDAEEAAFLEFAHRACAVEGDVLALEFRTPLDRERSKATAQHYRRYIDGSALACRVVEGGRWRLAYQCEGTGLAKFREDDAHVCRLLFISCASPA